MLALLMDILPWYLACYVKPAGVNHRHRTIDFISVVIQSALAQDLWGLKPISLLNQGRRVRSIGPMNDDVCLLSLLFKGSLEDRDVCAWVLRGFAIIGVV